jgi:protein-tyrosine phosphatase
MKTRVLVVCLGNICRSPLAHGIFENLLPSNDFFVDSAGTGGYHIGSAPDPRSIAVAKNHGLDISKQKARKFQSEDFVLFDRIFVMDSSNYQNVVELCQNEENLNKVELLTEAAGLNATEVPDPYYDDDGFEQVYQLIHQSCLQIVRKFIAQKKSE